MTKRMVAAIEHPWIDAIGHLTGRKIETRAPYAVDVDAVIEAAARTGTMLEINAAPDRRDLNDIHARAAAQAGVTILIDSDAHGAEHARHALGRRDRAAGVARQATREHAAVGGVRGLRKRAKRVSLQQQRGRSSSRHHARRPRAAGTAPAPRRRAPA